MLRRRGSTSATYIIGVCPSCPPLPQAVSLRPPVQELGAPFPCDLLDAMVSDLERMLAGDRVDESLGLLPGSERDLDPQVFEDVGDLSEQVVDLLESGGEQMVGPVLDRVLVPHVVDVDRIVDLPDALDAPLALLEA